MKRSVAAACLVFTFCASAPGAPVTRVFTAEDGLVRNWVQVIKKDSQGLLWFGTIEGLSLFDGRVFTNFTTADGLPSRSVSDILERHDGSYWLGTAGGVARFYPKPGKTGGHFKNFRVGSSKASNFVEVLFEDSQSRLWVGTSDGLWVLGSGEAFVQDATLPAVMAIAEDHRGRLWLGTESGLYLRESATKVIRVTPTLSNVPALLVDRRGYLWAGGGVLTEINPEVYPYVAREHPEITGIGKPAKVEALCEAPDGEIWVGGFGLHRFFPERPGEAVAISPLPSDGTNIVTISSDAHGNVWTNFDTRGAQRISSDPIEQIYNNSGHAIYTMGIFQAQRAQAAPQTGAHGDAKAIFVISQNPRRLIEVDQGGLREFTLKTPHPATFTWGWGVGAIALQDHTHEWWLASGEGAVRYSASDDAGHLATSKPRIYTDRDGLPDNVVLRLFEDSSGNLWAGCSTGLARWDRSSERFRTIPVKIPTDIFFGIPAVHSFAEDRSGAVWVGFAGPLLIRIRGERVEPIPIGLKRGFINALLFDGKGRLWIGSSSDGIGLIADPTAAAPHAVFRGRADGLSSEQIYSLTEDRSGRIYATNGHGVDRLDPVSQNIQHFTGASGLPEGDAHLSFADADGDVWFGSPGGLARYHPGANVEVAPPPPLLRSVSIKGKPYPVSALGESRLTGLHLSPTQDSLALVYRARQFARDVRLLYQYRLRDGWSTPAEQESVEFVDLGSGDYHFEVRTVSESGMVSNPAVFDFSIAPPIWARWWMLLLEFLAVAAGIYALHTYRVNHLLMVSRVRARLATDLHDDLGAGLAEISILSEVAKRRRDDSQLLDRVVQRARGLRASLSDIVWAVDPQMDRLSDLVNRMRDTVVGLLESGDCRVDFKAPPEEVLRGVELSPERRRQLLLFFKEAITNVARHSGATRVHVQIELSGQHVTILIEDNGRGFDPSEARNGYGLTSMRNRAAELDASLQLDAKPGEGVRVELVN